LEDRVSCRRSFGGARLDLTRQRLVRTRINIDREILDVIVDLSLAVVGRCYKEAVLHTNASGTSVRLILHDGVLEPAELFASCDLVQCRGITRPIRVRQDLPVSGVRCRDLACKLRINRRNRRRR